MTSAAKVLKLYPDFFNIFYSLQFYPLGPYELADSASKPIVTKDGHLTQLYVTAVALYTTEKAKALSAPQRKCRYYEESNLRHSPVYSYVICRMECRISLAKSLCGCIPHFYRRLSNTPLFSLNISIRYLFFSRR